MHAGKEARRRLAATPPRGDADLVEAIRQTIAGSPFMAKAIAYQGLSWPTTVRGCRRSNIFWASNRGEAGQVLHAYQSVWLPAALLAPDQ